jgi:ribosomal protein L32
MISAILFLALLQPQDAGLGPAPPPGTGKMTTSAPKTEKMTPDEVKRLADAKKALADAQDALIKAKANMKGTTDSIELAHHANTDCGCYINNSGREYDKVDYKGDDIIITHIHEDPPSLTKP